MRYAVLLLAIVLVGCGSSSGKSKELNSPDLQGKPPGPEDDPFFYVARPPPDAKADTKGTIGDESDRPPPVPAEDLEGAELRAELERARAEAIELRAENLELRNELDQAEGDATPRRSSSSSSGLNQCHSCVRVCPAKGRCADDAELVCGWGTGKRRKDAMLRATAECDGALEKMRADGPWSRIEGKCPVAKCS